MAGKMAEMIELARNSVQTWETDGMGHMNVQFYVEKAIQALSALSVTLGIGPRFVEAEGARLYVRDHHIRFLREQVAGSPFFIRGGVLDLHDFGLRLYQEMVNTSNGQVAASFISEVELQDRDSRETLPLPAKAKAAAKDIMIELPAHGAPHGLVLSKPLRAPTLAEAEQLGMMRTYQGEILPAQCDAQGFLSAQRHIGTLSDAIPNLLAQTAIGDRTINPDIGGAALEYRLIYRKPAKLGDIITVRTGLKQIGEKTYNWVHWLFDLETGQIIATSEAIAITMDLRARKAIPVPPDIRAALEALLIDGLYV
jgi:acyl-CoA thioester hydrolase